MVVFRSFLEMRRKRSEDPIATSQRSSGRGAEHEARVTRQIVRTRVFVFLFSKTIIYKTMIVIIFIMF